LRECRATHDTKKFKSEAEALGSHTHSWLPMKNEKSKRGVARNDRNRDRGFKRKIDLMSSNIKPGHKTL
jgi:hypothetical protein